MLPGFCSVGWSDIAHLPHRDPNIHLHRAANRRPRTEDDVPGLSALTGRGRPRCDGGERKAWKEEKMTGLLPRLFGDMTDWFEIDFPRPLSAIRLEDKMTDKEYVLRAELPGLDPDKDVRITVLNGVLTLKAERREEAMPLNVS